MEENLVPIPKIPQDPPKPDYTARGRELIFGGVILLISILMCNFVFYGGFNIGFAVAAVAAIAASWVYLRRAGHSFGWYEKSLLILSLVIAGGFGRSADGFVKLVMLLFLFVAVNLAFCLAAGKNLRSPDGALSILDSFRTFYRLGLGSTGPAGKGIVEGVKQGGAATRRMGAVGTGLLISVPILAVMIMLLVNADAAFEGLVDLLPEIRLEEYFSSAFWGALLGWILYSRAVTLHRGGNPARVRKAPKGLNALTVNTVLMMVCLVYVVYLLSQLAYLSGGLAGILPEGYTLAEYARRGFFEMAWLCVINLGLLCCVMWLIRAEGKLPLVTRIAGAFLGATTIFLVVTASAKMLLYIDSYGLTRWRVLTEVIMLWLTITTILVTIRLFRRRMPYMKAVVITAMVLGALVFWADVDTVVAKYNVESYRSGTLETVDVVHLHYLGPGAVPYLRALTEDENPKIAAQAEEYLGRYADYLYIPPQDWRGWNRAYEDAREILEEYRKEG